MDHSESTAVPPTHAETGAGTDVGTGVGTDVEPAEEITSLEGIPVATVIFVVTKFAVGAWVVVIAIPALILLFSRIDAYYRDVSREIHLARCLPSRQGSEASSSWPSLPSRR